MSVTKNHKLILITLFLLFTFITEAQTSYDKGYFIDNNQTKTECLIKNVDWKNNPTQFTYKSSNDSDPITVTIDNVSKFEIYDHLTYIRAKVAVDVNTSRINKLDDTKELSLTTSTLFLKLLVEGKSNLYAYKDGNLKRYYYSNENGDINILEYKEYINKEGKVDKNQNYKSQLWSNLKCDSIELNSFKNIDYEESDLIKFFTTYNTCVNDLSYTFKKPKRTKVFHMSLRPGLDFATAKIDHSDTSINNNLNVEFDRKLEFRFGIAFEYVLPFNNDKWSLIVEPSYRSFSSSKTIQLNTTSSILREDKVSIDYSSLEIPFGIRHYSFINDNSALFFNLSALVDIPFSGTITYEDHPNFDINSGASLALGIGFISNDKYSIEGRFAFPREIISKKLHTTADYSALSVILGYKLF